MSPLSERVMARTEPFSLFSGLAGFADLGSQETPVDLLERTSKPEEPVSLKFSELGEHVEEPSAVTYDDSAERAALAREQARQQEQRELERRIASVRQEAFERAQREFEGELASRLAEERRRSDRLRLEFARDRQRFFAAAEAQVVRLALAVASRILSREVRSDGLHLRATVKAALSSVQESSRTTLLVPADEVKLWEPMLERESAGKVKVMADATLGPGECVLETSVGRVQLGVDIQLEEVTRNFSEVLQVEDELHPQYAEMRQGGGF